MKIGTKLFISFFALFLLFIAAFILFYRTSQNIDYYSTRLQLSTRQVDSLTKMRAAARQQLLDALNDLNFSMNTYNGSREQVLPAFDETEILFNLENVESSIKGEFSDSDLKHLAEVKNLYLIFDQHLTELMGSYRKQAPQKIKAQFERIHDFDFKLNFLTKAGQLIKDQLDDSHKLKESLDTSILQAKSISKIFAVVGFTYIIVLIWFWNWNLIRRLRYLKNKVTGVDAGNLKAFVPLSGNDELTALSGAFNEMSYRLQEAKSLEDRQKETLLVASKFSSLGRMAGGIAHEINNPLAIISLNIDFLINDLRQKALPEREPELKRLKNIHLAVERVAKIIKSLITFSADNTNSPASKESLISVVNVVLNLCQKHLEKREILIKTEIPEDLEIWCRSSQIAEVLMALIQNADDAIKTLPEKWIEIKASKSGEFVEISVTDSGNGIAPETAAMILDPFFTTKDVGKGAGLGLSISQGIAKSHGGNLFLDSQCEHTRFILVLPAQF